MNKYGDIQYLLDRPEPNEIFLKARQIAGSQLQKQFSVFNERNVNSSYDGFKWIKAEITYPSFDDLTFAYKNSIFSVVIELIDNTGTSYNRPQKDILLKACEENNLIPCLFKVNLKELSNTPDENNEDYQLYPVEQGWNLFDARNNNKIDPLLIAKEELTRMSVWELSNFAVQIVRKYIEKEGNEVLSFCDLPEVNPQIWFKDKDGNINWVIVKHIKEDKDLDYRKWVGLEEKTSTLLLQYDGFFASVQFFSSKTNSATNLYRGDAMYVNYKGLERIYVS